MTTIVLKPNYITYNYYKLEKRKKKKTHLHIDKLQKNTSTFFKYFAKGNCMPSFHQLDNWYRKMIDCQQTKL